MKNSELIIRVIAFFINSLFVYWLIEEGIEFWKILIGGGCIALINYIHGIEVGRNLKK